MVTDGKESSLIYFLRSAWLTPQTEQYEKMLVEG